MSTATASVFFAILCLAAIAGTVVVAVVLLLARRSPDGALAAWRGDLARAAMPVAWIVATVTTLGSLYYSQIAKFVPCQLCWYQRIAMYPLVLVLGIAVVRRDRAIRPYVIAQCAVGAAFAAYHSFIQAFPPEGGSSFCTLEAPCTTRYVWELGFVSLPFMALTAFVFIIVLMLAAGGVEAAMPIEPAPTADRTSPDAGDDREAGAPDPARVESRFRTKTRATTTHPTSHRR